MRLVFPRQIVANTSTAIFPHFALSTTTRCTCSALVSLTPETYHCTRAATLFRTKQQSHVTERNPAQNNVESEVVRRRAREKLKSAQDHEDNNRSEGRGRKGVYELRSYTRLVLKKRCHRKLGRSKCSCMACIKPPKLQFTVVEQFFDGMLCRQSG